MTLASFYKICVQQHPWSNTCKPIFFKLVTMLSTTKLYSLIPVGMIYMFTQGDRDMEEIKCVQSLSCKTATQMFVMVYYV